MTFISYAGNLEDVMLWRMFKNITNGFYIDVGAYDPVIGSITKVFYDHGWRGINIEPLQQQYQRLCTERPGDINLSAAAGAEDGELLYYEIIPNTELSTLNPGIAERHRANGLTVVDRTISVIKLASICRLHAKQPLHFLKVDVEGAEQSVLLGMDFSLFRPWVVIVEATIPNSPEKNHNEWEYILLNNNYQYSYFDGVNRFYIAGEKAAELRPYFDAPPNHFDYYQRYSEYCLAQVNAELEQQKTSLEQRLQCANANLLTLLICFSCLSTD